MNAKSNRDQAVSAMTVTIDGNRMRADDAARMLHLSMPDFLAGYLAGKRVSSSFRRKPSAFRRYMPTAEISAMRRENAAKTFLYDFSADTAGIRR